MAEGWVISVPIGADDGDVYQLYPDWCSAGVAPPGSLGQLIRQPANGALHSIQVNPNGSDGGTVEFWDINGFDAGADVSSSNVITNAQLTALIARGKARRIYKEGFTSTVGSGITTAAGVYREFLRGLAVRVYNDDETGDVELNLNVTYGYQKVYSKG